MKKLLVLFVCAVCLAACQRGPKPEESLVAAGNAISNLDVDNIDKYIDITSILKNAFEVIKQKNIEDLPEDFDSISMYIPMAEPFILSAIKEVKESHELTASFTGYVKMIKVPEYKIISNENGIAKASVTIDVEELIKLLPEERLLIERNEIPTRNTLIFEMRQKGDYWEIVSLANLGELIDKVTTSKRYLQGVEKSRAAEVLSLFGAITGSQQRYYLVRDHYTQAFADLDLDFTDVNNESVTGNIFNTKNFTVSLIGDPDDDTTAAVKAVRNGNKYQYELCRNYNSGKIQCGGIDGEEICPLFGNFNIVENATCKF